MIISFAEDVVFVFTCAKRIENAKQFLKENFIEIIACAACIYDLIEITLYNSLSRKKNEVVKTFVSRRERHLYNTENKECCLFRLDRKSNSECLEKESLTSSFSARLMSYNLRYL